MTTSTNRTGTLRAGRPRRRLRQARAGVLASHRGLLKIALDSAAAAYGVSLPLAGTARLAVWCAVSVAVWLTALAIYAKVAWPTVAVGTEDQAEGDPFRCLGLWLLCTTGPRGRRRLAVRLGWRVLRVHLVRKVTGRRQPRNTSGTSPANPPPQEKESSRWPRSRVSALTSAR